MDGVIESCELLETVDLCDAFFMCRHVNVNVCGLLAHLASFHPNGKRKAHLILDFCIFTCGVVFFYLCSAGEHLAYSVLLWDVRVS